MAEGFAGLDRDFRFTYVNAACEEILKRKREDLIGGLGQCASAMVAIREFNAGEGTHLPAVYGCELSKRACRACKPGGRGGRPQVLLGHRVIIDKGELNT